MTNNKTVTFDASQWQPIETAPRGAKGVCWMLLAWGPEDDQTTGNGMRIGDRYFAAGSFFCIGGDKPFEFREIEVSPTHWMPLPAAPAATPTPAAQSAGQELREYGNCFLSNEDIDKIAETMPGGLNGFLKGWGWRNFARAVEGELQARYASHVNGGERNALHVKVREQADKIAELQALLDTAHVGDMFAADAQQVGANIRGEVAYQLHTRNRWLDMPTMRAIVDSAFDAAIAKNALTSPVKVGGDERELPVLPHPTVFSGLTLTNESVPRAYTASQMVDYARAAMLETVKTSFQQVSDDHILTIAKKCALIRSYTTDECINDIISFARAVISDKAVQEAHLSAALSADGGEESPSLTNPLTPYGMLVRALRITTATTLMDMARYRNVSPSLLSGMEFGRKPVTIDDAIAASEFFSEHGVAGTLGALTVALQAAIAANQAQKGE
ncbi:hypothetical protein [Pandoraea commovens]|uniref:DUF551 domain-containing protein n=1 Tax=Pandoraea commovens TaxID=2508289 RepID=A0A5E4XC92_9BURK|nr:hypothetical protein [Pandoraea commovens]VVE33927.1 hypothetical protein PCO31010_03815 [Pandoraea commovens]